MKRPALPTKDGLYINERIVKLVEDRVISFNKAILLAIICESIERKGICRLSNKKLAARLGTNPRTIQNQMNSLEEVGLVKRTYTQETRIRYIKIIDKQILAHLEDSGGQ